MPEEPSDVPRGLLFSGLRAREKRGPLLAFLSVIAVAGIALIWPVYPFVSGIQPYVLGLPFSFFWVAAWLVIVFVALVFYYRSETPDEHGN